MASDDRHVARHPPPPGTVMTVLGPVPADALGITLMHEHLVSDLRQHASDIALANLVPAGLGGTVTAEMLDILHRNPFYLDDNLVLDEVGVLEEELRAFKMAGGVTIVEVTNADFGRSPGTLVHLAQRTGLHIIMGCGHYRHTFHGPALDRMSVEQITEEIVGEINTGVGPAGPRAGIIGEIGVSAPIVPVEAKVLAAAARAQTLTKVALTIHVHPWGTLVPMGYEVVRILDREGADLSKVILGHLDCVLDRNYHRDMLQTGVNVEYDHFGHDMVREGTDVRQPSDRQRLEVLAELIDAGYTGQLLMSQDVCFKTHLRHHGRGGYAHILTNVLPLARELGIGDLEWQTILSENPRRILAH